MFFWLAFIYVASDNIPSDFVRIHRFLFTEVLCICEDQLELLSPHIVVFEFVFVFVFVLMNLYL